MLQTYVYPAKIFINVDFPLPEGPMTAVISPAEKSPLISFKIGCFPTKIINTC